MDVNAEWRRSDTQKTKIALEPFGIGVCMNGCMCVGVEFNGFGIVLQSESTLCVSQ